MALTPAEAAARLRAAGIAESEREARLLFAHAHNARGGSAPARGVAPDTLFAGLVERRARREPFALIVGHREFWSLSLAVSPATLIPRPESETLIEAALKAFPERAKVRRILDLGTGTGALLLALLSEFPGACGVGIDCVPEASLLADANARTLDLNGRARFLAGDWATAIAGCFDLVVANPPYVERGAISTLMPEVSLYEPLTALDGGVDGHDAYRSIFADLPRLLAPQGKAIVELGAGATTAVIALARGEGLAVAGVSADLAGIPRALTLTAAAAKKSFGSGAADG
ncbi:MAG: peptide chain release factor N(5)-glutamine methyltransferase [Acetobacteraceae bacterium]